MGQGLENEESGWNYVEFSNDTVKLQRLWVPGGWLVRTVESGEQEISVSITFYPDALHSWLKVEIEN